MKAITDQSQQQVFAALDDVTAKLCTALNAGNEAAKVLLVWLESLNTKPGNQNGSLSSTPGDCLMTADEVAEYLRLKKPTVYVWASDGSIPHLKVNGELRFRRSEIDAWIEPNNNKIETVREKSRQPVIRSRRSFPTANR